MRALAPLDGSEASYEALERGLELLRGVPGVEVTLLHVRAAGSDLALDPALLAEPSGVGMAPLVVMTEASSRDVLARGLDIAQAREVPARAKSLVGRVHAEILKEAAAHDLLLMHHLGPSRLSDLVLGHDAERLAREAPCPVLLLGPAP